MGVEQDAGLREIPGFLTRLVQRWVSEGISTASGVTEEAVRTFEERRGVRLPADLRGYFRTVGGISSDISGRAMDRDLIRFWRLDEVESLADSRIPVPDAGSWFVVADYSIWAWVYAIRLTADPGEPAPVAVSFGGNELVPVAASFEQFVSMYLERDPRVISPA